MTLARLVHEFLEYMEVERGRSQRTISNYQFYLGRFLNWATTRKIDSANDITQDLVREYRLWLNRFKDRAGAELKKNTQNYHLVALRAFLKYLTRRDISSLAPEKIELGKAPQRQVDFLEAEDLERLLAMPLAPSPGLRPPSPLGRGKGEGIIALRDKAILETFFSTGLRVSELAGLKRTEINPKKEEFTVRGKGGKLRMVFMSPGAREWLKKYLDARRDVSMYLFVRHDQIANPNTSSKKLRKNLQTQTTHKREDLPLTARSIQRIVEHYAKAAGITKHITPHTIRHTFATDLLRNGADIRSVQALLGHSSITTTQIYTHVTDTRLRKIHQDFHGKNRNN